MQPGTEIHGFVVESRARVDEIEADVIFLRHSETGARMLLVPCADDNKVFKISFPTHPQDDTGVAHILEHSVLNGSRKYPLKEPFAELAKGSLCTFLNAFTYPDRTCYPVASCNHDDFENLVDVYLDAVFNPLISENTFAQEGWHYDLESPEGPLTISGVVYNEMHGAYADPEAMLDTEIDRALFPESVYRHDSGGDPAAIPQLSYQQFCDFHRTYYHPGNGYIFLYGDLDVDRVLRQINGFLKGRGPGQPVPPPQAQPRFTAPRTLKTTFSAEPDTEPEVNSFLYRTWLLQPGCDPETDLALNVLFRVISGRPSAPLRKALIGSHLGADTIGGSYDSELFETSFGIGLKDSSPDRADAFNQLVDETLQGLVRDGIDPDAIEAAVNATEFSLREANFGGYPKGLVYALSALPAWIYGGDPLEPLRYEKHLSALRANLGQERWFEGLIQKWLLDNPHQLRIVCTPEAGKSEAVAEALAETLAARLAAMSDADKNAQIEFCDRLREAQDEPDTEEALASLPQLPLSALPKQSKHYPFVLFDGSGPVFSWSEQQTAGISYLRASFDCAAVETRLLPLLPFFGKACLQAGTLRRDYVALAQAIDLHTGGISAQPTSRSRVSAPAEYAGAMVFAAKCLTSKYEQSIELLREIWLEARFDDPMRLLEIARSSLSRMERSMPSSGHSYVRRRLSARGSQAGALAELLSGISQHRFLVELVARLETDPGSVMADLETLRRQVLVVDGLHFHVTGSLAECSIWRQSLSGLVANLPQAALPGAVQVLTAPPANEAFTIPANTHFVGIGCNLFGLGWQPHGAFAILETLIGRDYLWNRVRVKGGAYGAFMQSNTLSGNCALISYRDPNVESTFETFRQLPEFLRNLNMTRREFEKLVIGTIGSADSPCTPEQAGDVPLERYFSGLTPAMVQQRRDQLLGSDVGQLRDYADLMGRFADSATTCVVGSAARLEANAAEFETITALIP